MADVIAAYREAFSHYSRNFSAFSVYSGIANLAGTLVLVAFIIALVSFQVLSSGAGGIFAIEGWISLSTAGFSVALVIIAIGALIFCWIISGIAGAYLETVHLVSSGRPKGLGGFFSAVPRRATHFFIASAIIFLAAFLPLIILYLVSAAIGISGMQIVSIAILVFGLAYAAVASLLCIFAFPGMVLDNRRPLGAIAHSLGLSARNFVSVVLYVLILGILSLPSLLPIVSMFYVPLFLMPIAAASLLSFYRQVR